MSVAKVRSPGFNWMVFAAAALGCGAVLFWFDPARSGFYPICLFHRTTGLLCPGCGGLRAVHQLLHGHVAAAFHLNALFVVSLPLIGWAAGRTLMCHLRHQPFGVQFRLWWLWAGLVVVVVFGVVRNVV